MSDLSLALALVSCDLLRVLFDGPPPSREEERCAHLLRSPLLQRCVWRSYDVTDMGASGRGYNGEAVSIKDGENFVMFRSFKS